MSKRAQIGHLLLSTLLAGLGIARADDTSFLASVPDRCILGVKFEWVVPFSQEEELYKRLEVMDRLVEYQSTFDRPKIAIAPSRTNQTLGLFFNGLCDRKEDLIEAFFSGEFGNIDALKKYTFFQATYEDFR